MVDQTMVSCQIPSDWKAKIDRLAAERKKEPNQIIHEALAQYLGEDAKIKDSRLNTLETEVKFLRSLISQLDLTVKGLQQRSQTAIISEAASVQLSQTLQMQPNADEDDDSVEDEPDEILYDFLPPEERYPK